MEAAQWAPSSGNRQPWRYVVAPPRERGAPGARAAPESWQLRLGAARLGRLPLRGRGRPGRQRA
nr:nitroreductase family protein [Nocardioides convexus]